jgi:DNA-binding transcriptional ArsR family regulator
MVTKRPPTPRNQPAVRKSSWLTQKRLSPSQQAQMPATFEHLQQLLTASQQQPTGRRRGTHQQLPALPQLGGFTPAVTQSAQAVAPVQGPEPVAAALRAVRREAWRHRWQLSPAVAAVFTMTGAAMAPGSTTLALGLVGGASLWAAHKAPDRLLGRAWLSRNERGIVARWMGGAVAWTSGIWAADAAGLDIHGAGLFLVAAALGGATGLQTLAWLHSRRIRPSGVQDEATLSDQAKALLMAWPVTIGLSGPEQLHGSRIAAGSMREPNPGTIAFAVDLRDDVHAEDAAGDELRKHLERALRMGVGTVDLMTNREDSGQILITLTPTRHLEKVAAVWNGPILNDDGTIDLALTADGSDVQIALYNESGVEHGAIFGTTNVGKSYTLTNAILPGVCNQLEVVFYIDGGLGTSAPHLAGACDWWAVEDDVDERRAVIETVHRIMRARKERRKTKRIGKWRGRNETIPVITLVIDEATTVNNDLPEDLVVKVLEILREGRKLGVRVWEVAQDPMGTDLVGGRKARGLMAGGGSMIGHRPGDSTANTLAGSSSADSVDLRRLPPEPGWCAVIRRGKVVAKIARVRFADEAPVMELLTGITPRTLTGADLAAAGPAYRTRVQGITAAAEMAAAVDEGDDEFTDSTDDYIAPAAGQATAAALLNKIDDPGLAAHIAAEANVQPEHATEVAVARNGRYAELNGVENAAAAFRRNQGEMSRQAVLSALRTAGDDGASTAELADKLGLSKDTVNRRINDLVDQGAVERGEDKRTRLLKQDAVA